MLSEERKEEIHTEGWAVGYYDKLEDNPYPEGSEEAAIWDEGHRDGYWNH